MMLRGLWCRFVAGHDYERVPNLPEKVYGRWFKCEFCKRIYVEGQDGPDPT
jgi:hypothetical protein